MSYDLFLSRRNGDFPSAVDFERYFGERPHYTVQNGQAWYEHPDTGVYFSFDHCDPTDEDEVECWASFNLNFNRPHYFALEALPELEAFVSAFDLVVEDPQIDGMGHGEFVGDLFVSGWSKGNQLGSAAAGESGAEAPPTLPTTTLEAIWRWNYGREAFQRRLGDSIFVPRIVFLKANRSPQTATIWTDAIPVVLPRTDVVVIHREETAPRRLFRRRSDLAIATWAELEPILDGFPLQEEPLPHYMLSFQTAPDQILAFITSQPALSENPEGLSPDHVLNRELFGGG
jgi:hypothetical protein